MSDEEHGLGWPVRNHDNANPTGMSELKPLPCPWCSELPRIEAGIPVMIRCLNDDCRVYSELCADSFEEVVRIWNTRPASPALDRLKALMNYIRDVDLRDIGRVCNEFGMISSAANLRRIHELNEELRALRIIEELKQ